jgi:hypothetical protein
LAETIRPPTATVIVSYAELVIVSRSPVASKRDKSAHPQAVIAPMREYFPSFAVNDSTVKR